MLWWLVACQGEEKGHKAKAEDTAPLTDTEETTPGTGDTAEPDQEPQLALQFEGDVPQNLIIVSLDTTRRDHIGRFSGSDNTPNLDRLLAEGVSLDDHRSCSSWTAPSMTCVVTGRTPFELGWWPWTSDYEVPGFDPRLPTLAGQLQYQRGYRTALVTANTVFDSELNFDRGFQIVYRPSWAPADQVTNEGLAAAHELLQSGEPFYLHIHYIDPHGNYCPPEAYVDQEDLIDLGRDICYEMYDMAWGDYWYQDEDWKEAFKTNLAELYDAELEFWDVEFGRLLESLEIMGALDDALLVFVTDHGEQLYERGGLGHGLTLGAEENRSTAGFWAKNLAPLAWTGTTVHQDLAATLHELYGLTPPQPSSGIPVGLAPKDRFVESMLYWGPDGVRLSVARGPLQLTYDWWGETHFYDHQLDPAGLIDYYDPSDPDVQEFWVPMQDFIGRIEAQWPSAGTPILP